jgi:membrane associated rhomboid family serine protease
MTFTPAMLLVASLCGYAIGAVGGLLFLRRERLANGFCFSVAALAALSGFVGALRFLAFLASREYSELIVRDGDSIPPNPAY